jgi:hypothetical protein
LRRSRWLGIGIGERNQPQSKSSLGGAASSAEALAFSDFAQKADDYLKTKVDGNGALRRRRDST